MADNKTKKELKIDDYDFAAFIKQYTPEMLKDISKHSNAITSALSSIAKNYEKVIFNLYWIYKTKSYVSFGYDSIITYASEKFGFKKSSTYDFITLAERFGNKDFTAFDAKYKDYEHSKLSLIADKSDTEIESLELKPDMSVKEIKALVKKHDSASKSVQDSVDNESGIDSEKPYFQESLVINDNEVSLPESAADSFLSVLDYESYKPDDCFYLNDNKKYGWALNQIVKDYIENHMDLVSGIITYEHDYLIEVSSTLERASYKAVFFDNECVVRFFFGTCIYDVSFRRLESEKLDSIGYLFTVHNGEGKDISTKWGFINIDYIQDKLKQYPDCKITITLNNSNDNKEEGGKDTC
ncbi:MAG: hypothetical protein HDR12_06320 [Lachnospiraceae bacterium]|nr:hypothetical protein [Lachnospiraceae bacterium]